MQEGVKRQLELSPASRYRGYQPLGSNVTRYDEGFARDWHEGIDLYRETPVRSPICPVGARVTTSTLHFAHAVCLLCT